MHLFIQMRKYEIAKLVGYSHSMPNEKFIVLLHILQKKGWKINNLTIYVMNFGKEQQIQSKESIIKIKSDINEIGNKFRDQKAKIFENLIKLRNSE